MSERMRERKIERARESERMRERVEGNGRSQQSRKKKLLSLYIRINIITFHSFNPFSS